jgi:hypothetical protein
MFVVVGQYVVPVCLIWRSGDLLQMAVGGDQELDVGDILEYQSARRLVDDDKAELIAKPGMISEIDLVAADRLECSKDMAAKAVIKEVTGHGFEVQRMSVRLERRWRFQVHDAVVEVDEAGRVKDRRHGEGSRFIEVYEMMWSNEGAVDEVRKDAMRNVILPIYIIRGLASSVVLDPPASVFASDLPPKKPSNLIRPIGTKFQRTGRKDSGVSDATTPLYVTSRRANVLQADFKYSLMSSIPERSAMILAAQLMLELFSILCGQWCRGRDASTALMCESYQ